MNFTFSFVIRTTFRRGQRGKRQTHKSHVRRVRSVSHTIVFSSNICIARDYSRTFRYWSNLVFLIAWVKKLFACLLLGAWSEKKKGACQRRVAWLARLVINTMMISFGQNNNNKDGFSFFLGKLTLFANDPHLKVFFGRVERSFGPAFLGPGFIYWKYPNCFMWYKNRSF